MWCCKSWITTTMLAFKKIRKKERERFSHNRSCNRFPRAGTIVGAVKRVLSYKKKTTHSSTQDTQNSSNPHKQPWENFRVKKGIAGGYKRKRAREKVEKGRKRGRETEAYLFVSSLSCPSCSLKPFYDVVGGLLHFSVSESCCRCLWGRTTQEAAIVEPRVTWARLLVCEPRSRAFSQFFPFCPKLRN